MSRKKKRVRYVVTEDDLVAELQKLTGGTLAVLVLDTEPTMRKVAADTVNPWWIGGSKKPLVKLRKLARVRGWLGQAYEDAVNNMAKKGDPDAPPITVGSRTWGRKRPDASLVDYDGNFASNLYLDFRAQTVLSVEYAWAGNYRRVDERTVRPFLRGRKDAAVHWRNPNLSNVREVRFDGRVLALRRGPV